jgi:hypothetical protein
MFQLGEKFDTDAGRKIFVIFLIAGRLGLISFVVAVNANRCV